MKKVLILTYYWPPSGGAGVQRWVKFVKYLRDFDWEPIVYIPENPHYPILDSSIEKDLPENLNIIKHPIWEPYSFYKKFMGMKKDEKVQHGFIQEKKQSSLKQNISIWIRSNFFIPDARKFWIKPSIKYLTDYFKQHEKPNIIVSTGPPHSMHLIGMGLKKKLQIPWIADFRDPWTGIDFYSQLKLAKWADKKHHRLESEVLQTADRVITVGWNLAEELKNLDAVNVEVITNGFDNKDFDSATDQDIKTEKFSLSHIGSLNKDRNSTVLWSALSDLVKENPEFKAKLEIKLVGKVDHNVFEDLKKAELTGFLNKIAYVPHKEIPNILRNSNILLLLLNNTPNIEGIITGKIFEYLAAGRSILCIGSSTGDASRIINETKSGKAVDFNDKEGMKKYIMSEFEKYGKEERFVSDTKEINKYSRRNLTKKLTEVLNVLSEDK
jgi:glycosyltransferase involved in cell wall biosynthesis